MKVEELMIGDWYKWSAEGKDYFYQVKPEDFAKDYVVNFNSIPLTIDILEKNGFRHHAKYSDEDIWMNYEHNIEVVFTDYAASIRIFVTCDDDGYDILYLQDLGRTRYVHELQHALRLCWLTELADAFKVY